MAQISPAAPPLKTAASRVFPMPAPGLRPDNARTGIKKAASIRGSLLKKNDGRVNLLPRPTNTHGEPDRQIRTTLSLTAE